MAAFVAATSAVSSAAVASLAPAYASTTANDVALLAVVLSSTTPAITTPAGWAAVDTLDESITLRTKLFSRTLDGTESGSLTVSWTGGTCEAAVAMAAYRGIDLTTPVYAHGVTGALASGTSRANAAVSSDLRTTLQVGVFCDVQAVMAQAWTASASPYAKRADASSSATPFVSVMIQDSVIDVAPSGTQTLAAKTATSTQTGTAYTAYNVGLLQGVTASSQPETFETATFTAAATAAYAPPAVVSYLNTAAYGPIPTTGQLWPRGRK
jgi:hypothetical protein